jgi:hypothetical protein
MELCDDASKFVVNHAEDFAVRCLQLAECLPSSAMSQNAGWNNCAMSTRRGEADLGRVAETCFLAVSGIERPSQQST